MITSILVTCPVCEGEGTAPCEPSGPRPCQPDCDGEHGVCVTCDGEERVPRDCEVEVSPPDPSVGWRGAVECSVRDADGEWRAATADEEARALAALDEADEAADGTEADVAYERMRDRGAST